jgi:hypothetical protein
MDIKRIRGQIFIFEFVGMDDLVRRKPFKDYSNNRQRLFFQESSQLRLTSSLAESGDSGAVLVI